jgi:IclR family acetate operon transcriptional repressor
LRSLASSVGAAQLCVLAGRDVVLVETAVAEGERLANPRTSSVPAHLSAAGKALLADLASDELLKLYPGDNIPSSRGRTLRTRQAMLVDLREIRSRGFAVGRNENGNGLVTVARTLRNVESMHAAVSVVAPPGRIGRRGHDEIGVILRGATAVITQAFTDNLSITLS